MVEELLFYITFLTGVSIGLLWCVLLIKLIVVGLQGGISNEESK